MTLHRAIMDMQPHDVAAHTFSLVAIGGAIMHILPELAVVPPALYYTAMLWETKLVQHWLRRHKIRARHRRMKRK